MLLQFLSVFFSLSTQTKYQSFLPPLENYLKYIKYTIICDNEVYVKVTAKVTFDSILAVLKLEPGKSNVVPFL